MAIKTDKYQVGDNVTASKNIVFTTDASTGDLIVNKGVHDGSLTEVSRILNAGGGASYTASGGVARSVSSKLGESVSVLDFGAHSTTESGYESFNSKPAFQAAIDYLHSIDGGTLHIPYGRYQLDSYVTVYNFIRIEGEGFGNTGTLFYGSTIVVNNATAAFLCNGVQRFELSKLSFVALGTGIGAAYVYMGQTTGFTPPFNYTSKMLIEDCKISANMGGGFFGNFIYGLWSRTEFGFDGTVGTMFLPIHSYGDHLGNTTNMNLISHCKFIGSKGAYTVRFVHGSDLTIQNSSFEINNAQYTIICEGIAKSTIKDCYFETNNGPLTVYPITFTNGPGSGACVAITFTGNLCSLGSNNTHLIRADGASGAILFDGNVVYGLSGKNLTSTTPGVNKGFASFLGNYLDALVITPNAYGNSGTFTPLLTGSSGTNAHTYLSQAGRWERRGNTVDVWIFVRITAKDIGSGGFAQITGLTSLPNVDSSALSSFADGIPGVLSHYAGVTLSAGLTQLGLVLGSGNVITFLESGSATAIAQLAMSGISNAAQFCMTFSYITTDI